MKKFVILSFILFAAGSAYADCTASQTLPSTKGKHTFIQKLFNHKKKNEEIKPLQIRQVEKTKANRNLYGNKNNVYSTTRNLYGNNTPN